MTKKLFTACVTHDFPLRTSSGESILLDVLAPYPDATAGARPAVVFLHGGGFVGGDKAQFLGAASYLALRNGAMCVTVAYRTAPRHRYPAPVDDCLDVCQWLYARRRAFAIAPERMVLVGGSPGANIAALAMLRPGERRFQPVNAILLNGIMDLTDFYDRNSGERKKIHSYFNIKKRDETLLKSASPCYISRNGLNMVFLHGAADHIVPIEKSYQMADMVRQSNGKAEVVPFAGEGHAWFNAPEKSSPIFTHLSRFLDQLTRRTACSAPFA